MNSEHLDEVIQLGLNTPEFHTGTTVPQFYSKLTLEKWVQSPHGVLLVAFIEDNFAGFSLTAYNPDSRDGYIHCVALKKEYQWKKLGSQMLEYTLAELEKMGCNHVFGLVQTNNQETLKFMRKHGFEVGEPFHYVQRTLPRI